MDQPDLFQTLLDPAGVEHNPVFRSERSYPGRTYADPVKVGLNVKQLSKRNSGESWQDPRNPQY